MPSVAFDYPRLLTRLSAFAFFVAMAVAAAAAAGVLKVDPLGLALTLLNLFIATIVLGFSERYMRADPRRNSFALTIAGFSAALIGLAFANDLISFCAAWVISGRLLVSLVGHLNGCNEAALAAQRCKRSFLIGNAALVGGLALLGAAVGSVSIPIVLAAIPAIPPVLAAISGCLLVVAALARCALPPFSGWLLGSMSAPTPVSALMHGGFVNGGGFLLIRFSPLFASLPVIQGAVIAVGSIAAIYGGAVMLVRPDVKGALGGSTVSQMGFMLVTCGLGAYGAALWHLVAHGLFKAWLFLGSGSTIGTSGSSKSVTRRPGYALAISGVTLVAAALVLRQGTPGVAFVPALLAFATALSALSLVGTWQAWPRILLGGGLLLVATLGARMAGTFIPDGPAMFGGVAQLGVLALLLAGWVAQRLIASRGLPPFAYVRLVNSGALHAR